MTTINPEQIKKELKQFYGTMDYYRASIFPNCFQTDGVRFFAEKTESFWLVDAIFSHLMNTKKEEFQNWTIKVFDDNKGLLVGDDGNNKVIAKQPLDYTDLNPAFSGQQFFLTKGSLDGLKPAWILMLPSEY